MLPRAHTEQRPMVYESWAHNFTYTAKGHPRIKCVNVFGFSSMRKSSENPRQIEVKWSFTKLRHWDEIKDYFPNIREKRIHFKHFRPMMLRIDGIPQLWLIIINRKVCPVPLYLSNHHNLHIARRTASNAMNKAIKRRLFIAFASLCLHFILPFLFLFCLFFFK